LWKYCNIFSYCSYMDDFIMCWCLYIV
jgi:hypothetical protein